jgi:hypothetical protein
VSHPDEIVDERLLAVRHHRIVLGVGFAGVEADGLLWLALVEHEVVEGLHRLLVALEIGHE